MTSLKKITLFATLLIILPISAFAHSGKTDINGCHTNKKNGDYHCHTSAIETKSARTESRTTANTQAKSGQSHDFLSCESKTVCGEMQSCEEAKYFLNICHINKLDGNRDGIPCESICNNK